VRVRVQVQEVPCSRLVWPPRHWAHVCRRWHAHDDDDDDAAADDTADADAHSDAPREQTTTTTKKKKKRAVSCSIAVYRGIVVYMYSVV